MAPTHGPDPWPRPTAPTHGPDPRPRPMAPTHGPDPWPRPTAPTHGPDPRPRPMAPTHGPDPRPRPMAPTHGPDPWPRPTAPTHAGASTDPQCGAHKAFIPCPGIHSTVQEKARKLGSSLLPRAKPKLGLQHQSCQTSPTESQDQDLNQTTRGLDQDLNQTTRGLDQDLNQTTRGPDQDLNQTRWGPDQDLNQTTRGLDQDLNQTTRGLDQDLNQTTRGPDQDLNQTRWGPDQDLNQTTRGPDQDLNQTRWAKMAAGSNLSSEPDFSVNEVDYEIPAEDLPDFTRGPVFLGASVLMGAVLVLIMLVCGAGNLFFVWTLVRSGRLRTMADRLVLNLALSDALVALCCPLLFDYYTLRGLSWGHGGPLCAAVNYVRTLSLHVSTNVLLSITLDRYLAIVHPLRRRCRRWKLVVFMVWLVPVILTSSHTHFSGAEGVQKIFCGQVCVCVFQVWSVDHRLLYQSYFLSVMILQFLFPVGVMTSCYSQVCKELWFKTVPGFQTPQIRRRLLRRRRTVLLLVLVLAAYTACWSPYYVFSVLQDFHASFMSTQRLALTAFYAVDCLAMSNAVINTLCFIWVKKPDQTRTRVRIRLRNFIKTKSSLEENRTTSTRGTETETW
ncbi:prokineticin receptor 1a [Eucyclogobius newberryi]|uniref:prokineticin receptor 1a n=1 Tax=Eucyclogobius newberryi TaxID=166745 RepID=UPI003B5B853C